ncbi:uncharacterized protein MEPE_03216 [Melanopsichium pennsylvanicum]|uniref:Uncharacterized protein n=1 Tax=Melanopsichium pennsylvanicum TaxID=63383 RepID=A0AAJ4XMD7_9BASI|nr:uncharacterized protein MEPE_03216 [Melanopsichium pennsylvanicum]
MSRTTYNNCLYLPYRIVIIVEEYNLRPINISVRVCYRHLRARSDQQKKRSVAKFHNEPITMLIPPKPRSMSALCLIVCRKTPLTFQSNELFDKKKTEQFRPILMKLHRYMC